MNPKLRKAFEEVGEAWTELMDAAFDLWVDFWIIMGPRILLVACGAVAGAAATWWFR